MQFNGTKEFMVNMKSKNKNKIEKLKKQFEDFWQDNYDNLPIMSSWIQKQISRAIEERDKEWVKALSIKPNHDK